MLHVLTLNPAWDITYRVKTIRMGLNRAVEATERAGGKGINVARAIRKAGGDCTPLAVLAGDTGARIAKAMGEEGIRPVILETEGETRTNISLLADGGQALEINGPGCPMNRTCTENLAAYLAQSLRYGDILCLCGSLPRVPSVEGFLYTHLCRGAAMAGAGVVLDCAGEALREAVRCENPPMLIKPNLAELAELAGAEVTEREISPEQVYAMAGEAVDLTKTAVLCTLGSRGALWADGNGFVSVPAVPVEKVLCEKGAGDTYLGTFLYHRFCCHAEIPYAMEKAAHAAADLVAGQ